MTQPASTAPPSWVLWLRAHLDALLPASSRETLYRVVSAAIMGLTATGTLTVDKAYLWTQLGVATVTLLFALLYAGTSIRATFYTVVTASSAVLLSYGVLKGVDWAIIVAAVGQALGVSTAAAKAQPPSVTTTPAN